MQLTCYLRTFRNFQPEVITVEFKIYPSMVKVFKIQRIELMRTSNKKSSFKQHVPNKTEKIIEFRVAVVRPSSRNI